MRIDERVHGDVVILEPRGRLSVETETRFTGAIRRLVEAGRTRLVLDMAHVPSIDCRGLGAIVQAHIAARDGGGQLKLLNLTARSRRMLTVTGLLTVLSTCGSESEVERGIRVGREPPPRAIAAPPQPASPPRHRDGGRDGRRVCG